MDDATFSKPIELRWADLDPNSHVRHSVYYDWGAMCRVAYLEQQGVGLGWMARNAIGPVLFREELIATIEMDGAWLDLEARKIVVPPPEMVRAFEHLGRTEDFAVLPSST